MDNNTTSIAVIIPLYNREEIILDTLQALKNQTRPPDTLRVVDDASDDRSIATVEQWIKQEKPPFPVQILRHEVNKGAAAARNFGLSGLSRYEFVYFLDSDDVPGSRFIEQSLRVFAEAGDDMVAVSADRIMKKPDGEHRITVDGLTKDPLSFIYRYGGGIFSCTVLRTKTVMALGGCNESLPTSHDVDLFIRLAQMGRWGHAQECTVEFLCRENTFHLRGRYLDHPRRWASSFEFFADNYGVRERLEHDFLCCNLAFRWRHAGLCFIKAKMYGDGAQCLRRSLAWWPKLRNMSWAYLLLLPLFRLSVFNKYLERKIEMSKKF